MRSVTAGQDFNRVMNCFVYRDAWIPTLRDVRLVRLNTIHRAYVGHALWVLRMSCGVWCGVQFYVHSQGIFVSSSLIVFRDLLIAVGEMWYLAVSYCCTHQTHSLCDFCKIFSAIFGGHRCCLV